MFKCECIFPWVVCVYTRGGVNFVIFDDVLVGFSGFSFIILS